ncbi:MAG: hypothetical protein [Circular genetic element sp.]|nr:MAG: hypothetical protein [Circular genetic element sp.]
MAYGRRRKFKKRVNTNKAKYKTSAKAQSGQIIKLQKQVDSLTTKTKDMYLDAYFTREDTFNMFDGLGPIGSGTGNIAENPTFYVRELFNPAQLNPVFTTTVAFDQNQKVRLKSMIYKGALGVIRAVDPEQSPAVTPTFVQMWIVSLKKETGRQLLNDTQQLNQVAFNTLTNGTAFSVSNVNAISQNGNVGRRGNAMLNTEYFNIRAYRSFTMGNDTITAATNTPVANMDDVAKQFSIKIRMNNFVRSGAGGSPWKALVPAELNLQDRMWCIYAVCRPYSGTPTTNSAPNQPPINVSTNIMWKIQGSQ